VSGSQVVKALSKAGFEIVSKLWKSSIKIILLEG
jgi:hypothetical protein